HVLPRARGGTNRPDNLITLCSACHRHIHDKGPGALTLGAQAMPAPGATSQEG
ncbi:HNH endonuclease, partial [bacterium]|nr:HNH endonuclease [bacterium]